MASILKVKDKKGNVIDIPVIKGASAYEVAVANGFDGTEAEWLESLKGSGSGTSTVEFLNADGKAVFFYEDGRVITSGANTYNGKMLYGFLMESDAMLPIGTRIAKVEIKLEENGEYISLDTVNYNATYPVFKTATEVIPTNYGDAFFVGYGIFGMSEQWVDITDNANWYSVRVTCYTD